MDDVIFMDAEIRPNRSLSERGFIVLISIITLLNCASAAVFLSMGAVFVPVFLGADLLAVRVDGALRAASVEGRDVPLVAGGLSFRFYAPPAAGIELALTRAPSARAGSITVAVVSQRAGFPEGVGPGPRPPGLMAKPGMMPPWDELLESDMTIVARTSSR